LASWEGAFRIVGWRDWIFSAPSTISRSLLEMLTTQASWGGKPLVVAIVISAGRLVAGFLLSITVGAVLGVSTWRFKSIDEFLGPLFLGLQTLPSVCWVPLAILTLGLNEKGILFVIVMGSTFAIAIALRDGLRIIPPVYQRAGAMLGTTGWKMYRYVLLPASLPALASSLRQGFSFAWRSLIGAEMLLFAQHRGLGFLLEAGRGNADPAQVIPVMTVMVIIGILADRWCFSVLERRVSQRFGLLPAE